MAAFEADNGAQTRTRAVAALAGRQQGRVAHRQLRRIGVSARTIGDWIAAGRLYVVHRGVYAVGHVLQTREADLMGAVLAAGPGAVASHGAAAWLWGFDLQMRGGIEVTTPRQRRPLGRVTRHTGQLAADEVTIRRDIPVTGVSRTLFDLAAQLKQRELARALNEAERLQLLDLISLATLLDRYPRRPGNAKVRALLSSRDPAITETDMEERFLAFLDAYGLPRPRFNEPLLLRGRWIRPDCMWLEQKVIVELDGGSHKTDAAFHSDRVRDEDLVTEGWRTIRVTARRLTSAPGALAANLRSLLRP